MRQVTEDMVALSEARFLHSAYGSFLAESACAKCGETRQIAFPISEVGQVSEQPMNCNNGHEWKARAEIVR